MMGANYPSKKVLKTCIGQELDYIETSFFGPQYQATGTFCVVGPCPYTARKWFAEVTMQDDKIIKVK